MTALSTMRMTIASLLGAFCALCDIRVVGHVLYVRHERPRGSVSLQWTTVGTAKTVFGVCSLKFDRLCRLCQDNKAELGHKRIVHEGGFRQDAYDLAMRCVCEKDTLKNASRWCFSKWNDWTPGYFSRTIPGVGSGDDQSGNAGWMFGIVQYHIALPDHRPFLESCRFDVKVSKRHHLVGVPR